MWYYIMDKDVAFAKLEARRDENGMWRSALERGLAPRSICSSDLFSQTLSRDYGTEDKQEMGH
jgi:hypothetical protein